MKFFEYDDVNGEVILIEASLYLIKEMHALLEEKRNKIPADKTGKKKLQAYKETKFIYLFFDWESPYFQFAELDRYNEAMQDAGLTELEMEDPIFKAACNKYDEIQNSSKIGKLLKAALSTVDKITFYLENIDLNERDIATGKPIFKTKDIIIELKGCKDLIDTIKTLEMSFKKNTEPEGKLRGDKEAGMFD